MAFAKEKLETVNKSPYVKHGRKHRHIKSVSLLLTAVLICEMTGCSKNEDRISVLGTSLYELQNISADNSTSDDTSCGQDDSPLSIKKLIFSYAIHLPKSENANCEYFLFVQSDGSIYVGVYSDFYAKQFKFQRQLYGLNDVDFELLDDIKHIGYLSDSEVKALRGLIDKIDPESQAYNRNETELSPTVVDTVYYTYFCYLGDGNKLAFRVARNGNNSGSFYKTSDQSASEAVDIVLNNTVVVEWERECLKENGV